MRLLSVIHPYNKIGTYFQTLVTDVLRDMGLETHTHILKRHYGFDASGYDMVLTTNMFRKDLKGIPKRVKIATYVQDPLRIPPLKDDLAFGYVGERGFRFYQPFDFNASHSISPNTGRSGTIFVTNAYKRNALQCLRKALSGDTWGARVVHNALLRMVAKSEPIPTPKRLKARKVFKEFPLHAKSLYWKVYVPMFITRKLDELECMVDCDVYGPRTPNGSLCHEDALKLYSRYSNGLHLCPEGLPHHRIYEGLCSGLKMFVCKSKTITPAYFDRELAESAQKRDFENLFTYLTTFNKDIKGNGYENLYKYCHKLEI